MMAPDLPLEPAPRKLFSRTTIRPGLRRASDQAMLVPMTPPPTMRMSQVWAIRVVLQALAGRGLLSGLPAKPLHDLFGSDFLGLPVQAVRRPRGLVGVFGDTAQACTAVVMQIQLAGGAQRGERRQAAVLDGARQHHLVPRSQDLVETEAVYVGRRARHRVAAPSAGQDDPRAGLLEAD